MVFLGQKFIVLGMVLLFFGLLNGVEDIEDELQEYEAVIEFPEPDTLALPFTLN